MSVTLLDEIRVHVDQPSLLRLLRVKAGTGHLESILGLVAEAEAVGRPRAMYKAAYVDCRDDAAVVLDGIRLSSRVLCVNLEHTHRVFPFVATCGRELADWYRSQGDLLRQFWAETIAELALRQALAVVREHIEANYRLQNLSSMAPGSLEDWPVQEQKPLFELLGHTEELIGVRLTPSMVMVPTKSLSGIFFPSQVSFESCQLCPRDKCPGRRAAFQANLYEEKYGLAAAE